MPLFPKPPGRASVLCNYKTVRFLAHLSWRLTRRAYSIPMVRRPSVVRPSSKLSNLNICEASWPVFIKFYSVTGIGDRLHKVLGQIGWKLMATESPHWCIMGETMSPHFLDCFWSDPFLYLQVTRTCIKSRTSWNFGQIGPLTTELAALEHLKKIP